MSCEAITKKGTDCTNNAIPNTMYCGLHKNYDPDYRCQWTVSTAPTSRDCNEKVANKGDYCSFHQDDAQKLVIVSHMDLIITQIKPINQKTYPLNYDNVSDYTNWEGGVIKGAMMVDLGNKYRTFGIIF